MAPPNDDHEGFKQMFGDLGAAFGTFMEENLGAHMMTKFDALKQEIATLRDEIEALLKTNEALNKALKDRNARIGELERQLRERDRQVTERDEQISALETRLADPGGVDAAAQEEIKVSRSREGNWA